MFFFLATGPVSLQIDVVSNLPKKQDLENEVREKFAQLRRLSVELQNALFRWTLIRATTIQQLKSLAEHLKIIEPEFVLGFAVTRFIILYYFIIGWPLIVFLINKMTISADARLQKMIDGRLGLRLGKVQASIEEDHKVCLKLQQQLDFLENFISTLAEFLIPLNDNAVLLKEMGESGFEFLYNWIAREVMDRSTVTKVEFCSKFLRAATSTPTMSSSIPDQCLLPFLFLKLLGQTPWLALRLDVRLSAQGHARNTLLTVVLILHPMFFLWVLLCGKCGNLCGVMGVLSLC